MHHNNEEFIGVDVGSRRLGIARGSSLARIAAPLKTVPAAEALEELAELIKLHGPDGLVIGLPRNLDGRETDQTRMVRQWVSQAQKLIQLPFYWQDEALSSRLAERQADKLGHGSDAIAASIVLQDFLDTPKHDRVRC